VALLGCWSTVLLLCFPVERVRLEEVRELSPEGLEFWGSA
jgi:hypothetical protein